LSVNFKKIIFSLQELGLKEIDHLKAIEKDKSGEDKPPILKSWGNIYRLVIACLILYMLIFYLLTHWLE
jgi:hypothetical protein